MSRHDDIQVQLTRDPIAFRDRAWALLSARPECNVIATVLDGAIEARFGSTPPVFATVAGADGRVRAAALRTPPRALMCTELEPSAVPALVERWLREDPQVAGVAAVTPTARAIAEAWRRHTGGRSQLRMAMAMHALDAVVDPACPAPGALAVAGLDQLELIATWWAAFAVEAGVGGAADDVIGIVRRRIEEKRAFVWLDGDRPVSLVAVNAPVAGIVRVGPVYTPPEQRGRGYASSAVAATSRRMLAGGARRMMLFTDLANPTSNKIYADVGYRRFADWEEHALTAG